MPSVPVRRDIGSPSAAEVVEVERGSPHSESSLATTLPSVLVRRASCEVPGPMNVGNMDSISSLATTLPSVLVRKGSSSAVARLGAQFNGGAAKTSDEAVGLATAMPSVLASRASDEASVSQAGARVAGNDANPASGSEEIPLVRVRTWLSGSFSCGSKMVLEVAPPMEDVSAQAGLECQAAETQTHERVCNLDQALEAMQTVQDVLATMCSEGLLSEAAMLRIWDACEGLDGLADGDE